MSSKVRSIQRARDQKAAKEAETVISVSYGQLLAASNTGALAALFSQRFRGRLIQMVRLAQAIETELGLFEKAKTRVIEQNGGKVSDAGTVEFGSKTKTAAADKEFQELLATEVEIKGLKLSDEELEGSSLTPAQALSLTWLMTENDNG